MDEPLGFGRYSHLQNACQSSLADLAGDIAGKVFAIRQIFPAVQIGDIEGIGQSGRPDDVDSLMEWTKAYESAAGAPLSFLHVDVQWAGRWQPQIKRLASRLHTAGIEFGIIYNGDTDDQTNEAWTRHAERRFAEVEADPALVPDHAILQTWMRYPTHMLPETQPGTMTWLVDRYRTAQTRLALGRTGDKIHGEITDTAGQPLAGVPVALLAATPGEPSAPVMHTRSGSVPPKATAALMALRINAECNCFGPADIAIAPFRYKDDQSGQTVQQTFRSPSAAGDAASPAHFQVQAGQPVLQNTSRFPVTANDPFTVNVPMRTDLMSAGSGYVALIFLSAEGKEIARILLPFTLAEQSIGTATTDAQGRFSLVPNAQTLRASVRYNAEFPGDAGHRSASATTR